MWNNGTIAGDPHSGLYWGSHVKWESEFRMMGHKDERCNPELDWSQQSVSNRNISRHVLVSHSSAPTYPPRSPHTRLLRNQVPSQEYEWTAQLLKN